MFHGYDRGIGTDDNTKIVLYFVCETFNYI